MSPTADRPTVRAAVSFDANTDASNLKSAMKGIGTNEKEIIQILGRRTSHQRQQILRTYESLYGKELISVLKKELSGDLEKVVLNLMTPITTYLAQQLKAAMKGLGTDEKTLIEILCSNDNKSLKEIKIAYNKLYEKALEDDLKKETSGDLKKLLVMLVSANRQEAACDLSLAPGLAQALYKAGEKKRFGTDEAEFSRIISSYSFPLLRCVFDEYEKITGKSFEHAIESELSGDYKEAILSIYLCSINKHTFFAKALYDSMKGFGTHDEALMRIVISRCEIDMGNIKDEYSKAYGKRLEEAITSDTDGDYKKILLALVQG
ncbi:UNVERIFIED_CONTAM: hypothetical protein GTU68_034029 [Idotea baltica]|nr:hypothetical protein [Idotea baltica]